MLKRGIVALASLLLASGTIDSAKAVTTTPTMTPGIYDVSFWLNTTTGSCAHMVNPSDPNTAYFDSFSMAVPQPGYGGLVEYYSLAYPDAYAVQHVILYPTMPLPGEVWKGRLYGDPLEEGTKGGHFFIHVKSVTTYLTLATMEYHGNNADGTTCVVTANLAFALKGNLP